MKKKKKKIFYICTQESFKKHPIALRLSTDESLTLSIASDKNIREVKKISSKLSDSSTSVRIVLKLRTVEVNCVEIFEQPQAQPMSPSHAV